MQAADKDGRATGGGRKWQRAAQNNFRDCVPDSASSRAHGRPYKRTRVSPEIWHDTLSLLCDADYAVRADYAEALVFYLRTEIRKRGDSADADGIKRIRPLAEGPIQQATNMKLLIHGDSITRALNAAHGYIYLLATASSLGFDGSSQGSSAYSAAADAPSVTVLPATRPPALLHLTAVPKIRTHRLQSPRPPRRSMTNSKFGKHHLSSVQSMHRRLEYQHLPQQRHPTTLTSCHAKRGTRAVTCPWFADRYSHVTHARRCYKSQGPRRYRLP